MKIRLSIGTAIIAGLAKGKLDAAPTTAYLMTYKSGKCSENCGFCSQARTSKSNSELLSRITWPIYQTTTALKAIGVAAKQEKFKRICIQSLNYPDVFLDLEALIKELRKTSDAPISVSCQPLKKENTQLLKDAGVERLGIALDAATENIFEKIKGEKAGCSYAWQNQFEQLSWALSFFGRGNVSTHFIVGLGETEKEIVQIIQQCFDMGVLPALFAFTPVHGTVLEKHPKPSFEIYRRVQLARYLIVKKIARFDGMRFSDDERLIDFGVTNVSLKEIISTGTPFLTSGCPDCNRPFYNEKPSGPLYNFPKEVELKDIEEIKRLVLA